MYLNGKRFSFQMRDLHNNINNNNMEEAQSRIQNAVNAEFSDIHKNVVRQIEGNVYRCMATCCDDKSASNETTQACTERCSDRLKRIQNFMESEVQTFQNRLQRCGMDCQDKARDRFTPSMSEEDQRKLRKEVEQCGVDCVDMHLKLLPALAKRIRDYAANNK